MGGNRADALDGLREAFRAYGSYRESLERGMLLVNASDDAEDIVEAARLNVGEHVRACQSLGLTDDEIEAVLLAPPRVERDPERGRAAAVKLKKLGAHKILIKAAEQGYITQVACQMPECFCPEELGGACYFDPETEMGDWMPTLEHFPVSKEDGGKDAVYNARLAHRLCNRMDHSIRVGRSYVRDLERIRKAREDAIRRDSEGPDTSTRI